MFTKSKHNKRKTYFKFKACLGIAVFVCLVLFNVSSAQMTSTNYGLESDSINFAGNRSTSASYQVEDTIGESATGRSTSASYGMNAGYQEMHGSDISITAVADVLMDTSVAGITGGTSNGSTTVTVTTDSTGGYQLTIQASTSPALVSGSNYFADYTQAGANPDFTFSIATTDSEFGFTPEGTDVVAFFLDDGSTCNTGALNTADACWSPLSTSATIISTGTGNNSPLGTATVLKFRAASGSSHFQVEGTYVATTTVTAIAL
jgi:hypothetical protein